MQFKIQRAEGSQTRPTLAPKDVAAGEIMAFHDVLVAADRPARKGSPLTFHKRATLEIPASVIGGDEVAVGPLYAILQDLPDAPGWKSVSEFVEPGIPNSVRVGLVEKIVGMRRRGGPSVVISFGDPQIGGSGGGGSEFDPTVIYQRLDIIQSTDIPGIKNGLKDHNDALLELEYIAQAGVFDVKPVTIPAQGVTTLELKGFRSGASLRKYTPRPIDDGRPAFDADGTSTWFAMNRSGVYLIRIQLRPSALAGEDESEVGSMLLVKLRRVVDGVEAEGFVGELDLVAGHWTSQGLSTMVLGSAGNVHYLINVYNTSETSAVDLLENSVVIVSFNAEI